MLPTFSDATLSRLPAASRDKAVALDNARQAAHAALASVTARLTDAYRRRDTMAGEIEQQIEDLPGGQRFADEIEAMRAPVKVLDAQIAQLKAEVGRAEREFQTHDCAERAAKWLTEAPQMQRPLKHQAPPKVKAGSDLKALVEKTRARIDDLAVQIEAVELAPAPADDLRARIAEEVDRLAEGGQPVIDQRDPGSIAGAIVRASAAGTFAIWLNRDGLVAKLQAEVVDAPNAMSAAEKDEALAELAATLLEAERDEEAIISAAHAAGTSITRRRGADARALLDLQ